MAVPFLVTILKNRYHSLEGAMRYIFKKFFIFKCVIWNNGIVRQACLKTGCRDKNHNSLLVVAQP